MLTDETACFVYDDIVDSHEDGSEYYKSKEGPDLLLLVHHLCVCAPVESQPQGSEINCLDSAEESHPDKLADCSNLDYLMAFNDQHIF